MSLYGGVDPGPAPPVPPMPSYLALSTSGSAAEKFELDAKWIGDFIDDLSVAIALRRWDEAIELVDKGRIVHRVS
jgi:exocyst complex component 8